MIKRVYRAIWVIAYRELLRFFSDRARAVSSFSMPLIFLIIFGAGFKNIFPTSSLGGVNFLQFIYPGIIAQIVLFTALFSGLSVVWDKEFGFLKEVLVAPLSRTGVLLGKAVGSTAIALCQGAIMLVLAPIVGVHLSLLLVLKLIPLLVVLSLSLSGFGLLVAARMRSQQGFQVVMQLLLFPLMFLSGILFPVNKVPMWLEVVSKINPVTYGVDAVRQVFLANHELGVSIFGHTMSIVEDTAVVVLIGAMLMTAAILSFNRQD
jgi:ABC-2 type transport system permease protein